MTVVDLIPQKVEDGWALYWLTRLEVEVTVQAKQFEPRKVTAILETPKSSPVQVAVSLFPGNGRQPENTISLQGVADQVQLIIQSLEDAINESVKQHKGDSW